MVAASPPSATAHSNGKASHHRHSTSKTAATAAAPPSNINNVRVVGRIRPLAAYEKANGSIPVIKTLPSSSPDSESDDIIYVEPPEGNSSADNTRWFQLDAVLDGDSTQEQVYQQSGAQQAVTHDLFHGFNCTILAYGQTGAGKTFTMGSAAAIATTTAGVDESLSSSEQAASTTMLNPDCGVIPRACADLFATIQSLCQNQATVELSYMEVYNEEIRDLLSPNNTNSQQQQLRIREQLNGEVYVRGLEARPVTCSADVGKLMEEASRRRVTASTNMNAVSSRSHAICVLRLQGIIMTEGSGMAVGTKFQSKLTLVDLAGSERILKRRALKATEPKKESPSTRVSLSWVK
jgi:hypothetical protein